MILKSSTDRGWASTLDLMVCMDTEVVMQWLDSHEGDFVFGKNLGYRLRIVDC